MQHSHRWNDFVCHLTIPYNIAGVLDCQSMTHIATTSNPPLLSMTIHSVIHSNWPRDGDLPRSLGLFLCVGSFCVYVCVLCRFVSQRVQHYYDTRWDAVWVVSTRRNGWIGYDDKVVEATIGINEPNQRHNDRV